jgi:bifunctional enzyme CysN/CysC
VRSIEAFNVPPKIEAHAGEAIGITLETQLYIKPGEVITTLRDSPPKVNSRFKANIFWMGRSPLIKGRSYKLKLATCRIPVTVAEVLQVLDAAELHMTQHKQQLDRHDVGEVVLESAKPIAFDPVTVVEGTGRFVIVDNYEIAGGGIILEDIETDNTLLMEHIREREITWDKGFITPPDRAGRNRHGSKFIVFAGEDYDNVKLFAKELERALFLEDRHTYYLGLNNMLTGLGSNMQETTADASHAVRVLGELARILTDSGQIFITALSGIDDYDLQTLKMLNSPAEILVICIGPNLFSRFDVDLVIQADAPIDEAIPRIGALLREKEVIPEYYI